MSHLMVFNLTAEKERETNSNVDDVLTKLLWTTETLEKAVNMTIYLKWHDYGIPCIRLYENVVLKKTNNDTYLLLLPL